MGYFHSFTNYILKLHNMPLHTDERCNQIELILHSVQSLTSQPPEVLCPIPEDFESTSATFIPFSREGNYKAMCWHYDRKYRNRVYVDSRKSNKPVRGSSIRDLFTYADEEEDTND